MAVLSYANDNAGDRRVNEPLWTQNIALFVLGLIKWILAKNISVLLKCRGKHETLSVIIVKILSVIIVSFGYGKEGSRSFS